MAKLKEGVKEERKEKIHQAAIELFTSKGFINTTMDAIAREAGFAVGTLYNYYESKGDLLLSISTTKSALLTEEVEEVLNREKEDTAQWITDLLSLYFKNTQIFSRELWREFFGYSLMYEVPIFQVIRNIDLPFLEYLATMVSRLQEQNRIASRIPASSAVESIYEILQHTILHYITGKIPTENEWQQIIGERISLLLSGLA